MDINQAQSEIAQANATLLVAADTYWTRSVAADAIHSF